MIKLVEHLLEITPTTSQVMHCTPICIPLIWNVASSKVCSTVMLLQGDRRPFVMETVKADDNAKLGMFCTLVLIIMLNSVCVYFWTFQLQQILSAFPRTRSFTACPKICGKFYCISIKPSKNFLDSLSGAAFINWITMLIVNMFLCLSLVQKVSNLPVIPWITIQSGTICM